MKKTDLSAIRIVLGIAILMMVTFKGSGQAIIPEELSKNSLQEQMNYLEEHTRIYENYRAIREDIFQKVKGNVTDSLSEVRRKIGSLNTLKSSLNRRIDSLQTSLETTKTSLNDITRTKNRIKVLGMEINKLTYNTVMWTIIVGLIVLLAIGFLVFKRNISVTTNTKKELKELKDEFEAYRKTSREAREKMSMDHFNEMKKYKGG